MKTTTHVPPSLIGEDLSAGTRFPVRRGPALAVLGWLLCLEGNAADPDIYEPVRIFEVRFTEQHGGPPATRVETCLSPLDLPWVAFEARRPWLGYVETTEPAEVTWEGRSQPGRIVRWDRGNRFPRSFSGFDHVTFRCLPALAVPTFHLTLPAGATAMVVPQGCVALEVAPVTRQSLHADAWELTGPISATGSLAKATVWELDGEKLPAWEFAVDWQYAERRRPPVPPDAAGQVPVQMLSWRAEYTLSDRIEGGICKWKVLPSDPGGHWSQAELVLSGTAPLPPGMVAFREQGFGWAAPPGFARAERRAPEEIVRWSNAQGHEIAVVPRDFGPKGPEGWADSVGAKRNKKGGPRYILYSGGDVDHIAGVKCRGVFDTETKIASLGVQRGGGQGFLITLTNYEPLSKEDRRAIFAGWRWIRPDAMIPPPEAPAAPPVPPAAF